MYKHYLAFLLLMPALCIILHSQTNPQLIVGAEALEAVETLHLPPLNNEVLIQEEMDRRSPGTAPRFAETMLVDISPATHGTWTYLNDLAIWRLRIPSPGAKSLNFGFDQYVMPAGGRLMLFTPDELQVQGPFTPADNEEHEELWTPVIPGDEVVIEVSLPASRKDELRLHLKSVNHDFLGFGDVVSSFLSGSCNLDVACGAADGWEIVDKYRDIIQSVGVYGLNGSRFCTGFLINNTRQDCTPFFMTANHCEVREGDAPSVVVYWNYANSYCREPGTPESGEEGDGILTDFNSGSVLRASYAPSDMTLLELDDPVSPNADAWFAGWDARNVLPQDTVVTIHHPSNDEKRISFEYDGTYRGEWGQGPTPIPNGNHLVVADWDVGTTEGGSSGAPLFNKNLEVIGQLHGGAASCSNNQYDSFGWFHTSWEGGGSPSTRLRDWLDPINTGNLQLSGRSRLQCFYSVSAEPSVQSLCAPMAANFDISVSENFNGPVSLSIDDLPGGLTAVFDSPIVNPGESTQMSITGTDNLASGAYDLHFVASDGAVSSAQVVTLDIFSGVPHSPVLSEPANQAINQPATLQLGWLPSEFGQDYTVELATDLDFTDVILTRSNVTETNLSIGGLNVETVYFWRVRANNFCGEGNWSSIFRFTTGNSSCGRLPAETDGFPVGPDAGAVTISEVIFPQMGEVTEVNLFNLSTDHSWTGDLDATLTSPEGTIIDLFNRPDCDEQGMFVSFSDGAAATANDFENTCNTGPIAIQGTFQSATPLATFAGEEAGGPWTLAIRDNADQDGGVLLGWDLEVCTVGFLPVSLSSNVQNVSVCVDAVANLDLTLGLGFTNTANVNVAGLPPGATINYEANPAAPGTTLDVNISGLSNPGVYPLTFTAVNGAEQANAMVQLEVLSTPISSALQLPANNAAISGGIITYTWTHVPSVNTYRLQVATDDSFDDLVTDQLIAVPSFTGFLPNGQYFWRVMARNECGESVSNLAGFTVDGSTATVEIAGVEVDIWPNPTNGPLTIQLADDLGGHLITRLFTINGQLIRQELLNPQAGTIRLDVEDLPAGVYLLQLQHDSVQKTVRIVKQ